MVNQCALTCQLSHVFCYKLQIEAGFKAAAAESDRGVHRVIKHTDMRTFWKTYFSGLDKVSLVHQDNRIIQRKFWHASQASA